MPYIINEPQYDKTNKMTCAPSKDSDQPALPRSLIRMCAVRFMGSFLHADSEDSDQTGRMPRLISFFSICWFCHAVARMELKE